MVFTVKISELPASQAISAISGTLTIDKAVVGSLTPEPGAFTTISATDNITIANGKAIRPDTTTGHTVLFQAYDVDGTAFKTFVTFTNANTPSMAIAAPSGGAVTIDGAVIGGTTALAGTFTTLTAANAIINAAAGTMILKQGANGKTGTVTLNGVTPVTVTNSSITANSGIIFTLKTASGTVGACPAIQTITPTTGFTVAGTALDVSVYNYHIIESAA